jgi:hypothetical protein
MSVHCKAKKKSYQTFMRNDNENVICLFTFYLVNQPNKKAMKETEKKGEGKHNYRSRTKVTDTETSGKKIRQGSLDEEKL